jgi:phosphoribosyl 1,2-cyclic phosphodiesterase
VIRFASLGSGSAGNALLVESGATRILVDCGFGLREAAFRLGRLGLHPEELTGIVVTHEHGDHAGGVFALARRYLLPVWLSHGTLAACAARADGVDIRIVGAHSRIVLGDLEAMPYTVPHDAREPLQYVFSDGVRRLGVLTDAGEVTPHVCEMLDGVSGLVLECNHDPELLLASDYPPPLRRRIAGRLGHLANEAAAGLLRRIDCSRLQHVVAAHLSERNNRPELAVAALAGALGCAGEWVAVASQDKGFDWRSLA